jgi:hypothetical protein
VKTISYPGNEDHYFKRELRILLPNITTSNIRSLEAAWAQKPKNKRNVLQPTVMLLFTETIRNFPLPLLSALFAYRLFLLSNLETGI